MREIQEEYDILLPLQAQTIDSGDPKLRWSGLLLDMWIGDRRRRGTPTEGWEVEVLDWEARHIGV